MSFDKIHKAKNVVVFFENDYAEYADITNGTMGAFKPVTDKFIDTIAAKNIVENQLSGRVFTEIIGYEPKINSYKIVFTTEQKIKTLNHNGVKIDILFPKMIWLYDFKKSLSIYQYDNLRVDGKLTKLNFSNVNNSIVCIGTSPHPTAKDFYTALKEIQEMFFNGEFNHSNNQITYVKEKLPLWKTVLKFLNT